MNHSEIGVVNQLRYRFGGPILKENGQSKGKSREHVKHPWEAKTKLMPQGLCGVSGAYDILYQKKQSRETSCFTANTNMEHLWNIDLTSMGKSCSVEHMICLLYLQYFICKTNHFGHLLTINILIL